MLRVLQFSRYLSSRYRESPILCFAKVRNTSEYNRLYELSDIMNEIECMKEDGRYKAVFGQYNTSAGVTQVLSKLPYGQQQKLEFVLPDTSGHMAMKFPTSPPPFCELAQFIRDMNTRCNDPCLTFSPIALMATSPRRSKPTSQNLLTHTRQKCVRMHRHLQGVPKKTEPYIKYEQYKKSVNIAK